jgi:pyruvate/2-oxoglutarate dehydrogenase complex dihydrolipoamide acyltransferase (E2) component
VRARGFGPGRFREAGDPTGYLCTTVRMDAALERLERSAAASGLRLTPTHLLAHVLSQSLREFPDTHVLLRLGRVERRAEVVVSLVVVQPGSGGRTDLGLVTLRNGDTRTLESVAAEIEQGAQDARQGRMVRLERSKRRAARVPGPLLGFGAWLVGALQYGLNLSLAPLGFPRDPFGGVALSNVGSLGLDRGYAPLVPHTHVPLVVAMGAVRQAPRVESGRIVAARVMDLTYTFDRRAMTELEVGALAEDIVRRLERPLG